MRPLPDPEHPEFAEFWAAARENRIVIPRCGSCGTWRWPPRAACAVCFGGTFAWEEVLPTGTVHTWTRVGNTSVPGIEAPYTVVIVDLDGAPGVRLLGGGPDPVAIGDAVVADFRPVSDTVTLVDWRAAR